MKNLTPHQLTLLLLVTAAALTASGFILEHVFHAAPCRMCWWQRYAHWSIIALATFGLITKCYKPAALTTLAASATGLGIAIWQMGGQNKWWKLPEFCQGNTELQTTVADLATAFATLPPRCDEVNFTILNISLAEWNIPAMLFTAIVSLLIIKESRKK